MKAAVIRKHGSPNGLEVKQVAKPVPQKNQILIKVMATTVTSGDAALRRMSFLSFLLIWPIARFFFGIKNQRKKIVGHEFAGEVVAIGKNVKKFNVGDHVFGTTGYAGGAHAEFVCLPEDSVIARKPDGLTFEQAAALPIGAICALNFLRKGKIQKSDNVLIYGASGSIGTYGVQLASYFGADVTGVCSTENVELVKSLGADKIIDYSKTDFTSGEEKYDLIFDTVGKISRSRCKNVLAENGRFLSTHSTPVQEHVDDLIFLRDLVDNSILHPVIDRQFALELIAEAHSYVDLGHKKGNVVITINHRDDHS